MRSMKSRVRERSGRWFREPEFQFSSDDDFPASKRTLPLINMAWHIAEEIETYLRGRGFSGEIINIISPDDFAA